MVHIECSGVKDVPEARISLDEGGVELDCLLCVFDCGCMHCFARVGGGAVGEIDSVGRV